jgi:hypothetical protein
MRGHTRIILIWQYITYDRSLFILPFVCLMEVARFSVATIAVLCHFPHTPNLQRASSHIQFNCNSMIT